VNTKRKEQPYSSQLKGVQALLGELPNNQSTNHAAVVDIIPSSTQPRYYFDPEKQQQLVQSVKQFGILEPLLVRPIAGNKYEIVAGERRYRAAVEAEITQVPIVVKELNDDEALHLALIENLQRLDLNPIEETEGILTLLSINLTQKVEDIIRLLYRMQNEVKGKVTQNVLGNPETQQIVEIFQSVGTISWESFVTSRLPLLKLPSDILDVLREGKIEYTKATAIAKVKDETQRAELLKESIQNSLSLTQIKERIATLKPSPDLLSPKNQLQTLTRRLNQLKLWEKDKKTWKKVEGLLGKIEMMLTDVETEV
jgi:ParB family chromosome partitioning protein